MLPAEPDTAEVACVVLWYAQNWVQEPAVPRPAIAATHTQQVAARLPEVRSALLPQNSAKAKHPLSAALLLFRPCRNQWL